MKRHLLTRLIIPGLAFAVLGCSAWADDAPPDAISGATPHALQAWRPGGLWMRHLEELNLSTAQQQQIQAILQQERPRWRDLLTRGRALGDAFLAADPDSADYAASVLTTRESASQLAVDMVTAISDTRQKINAVLTVDQRQKLMQMIATVKSHRMGAGATPGAQ